MDERLIDRIWTLSLGVMRAVLLWLAHGSQSELAALRAALAFAEGHPQDVREIERIHDGSS